MWGPGTIGGSRGHIGGEREAGQDSCAVPSTAIGVTLYSSLVTPSGHSKRIISSPHPGTKRSATPATGSPGDGVASWGERALALGLFGYDREALEKREAWERLPGIWTTVPISASGLLGEQPLDSRTM